MEEKIKSVWIGHKLISVGDTLIKDNVVYFKPINRVCSPKPIVSQIEDTLFQERDYYDPVSGKIEGKFRIFMSDLRGNKFTVMSNPVDQALIKSLNLELNAKNLQIERQNNVIKSIISNDHLMKQIKTFTDVYGQIRGYKGSGYSGMSQIGRQKEEPEGDYNEDY